jgi:multimeric flavodoxin WrbA
VKTLLGLIASPRRLGNSELIVKEIHRQLPDEWELKLIRMPKMDIRPCIGCYQCLFGKMKCVQKDDTQVILEALVQCDAYVVATPTYVFGSNASLKRFLDRALSFYGYMDDLWGKPAVGVVIAGFRGLEGYTKLTVDSFIKFTLAEHRGSEVIFGALPGEIFLQGEGKKAAKRLAQAVMTANHEPTDRSSAPVCQLCGGDTFRFLDRERVKCMLCSSEGSYSLNGERVQMKINVPEHPLFFSYEDAKNHLLYLQGLKEKFMAQRKEIKEMVKDYGDDGTWISPDSGDD